MHTRVGMTSCIPQFCIFPWAQISVPLEHISENREEKKVTGSAWVCQDKPCLTKLIVFYNNTDGFVNKERAGDAICLKFGRIFGIVSHNVLVSMFGHRSQAEWVTG